MIFLEPAFLVFALVTIVVAHHSPRGLASVWLGLGINLSFMLLFLGPAQSAILLGFAGLGYAALRSVGEARSHRTSVAVLTLLAAFVVLKQYSFLPESLRASTLPVAVGLSYVLFRLLHLVIDRAQGAIATPDVAGFLRYTLNGHALLSGPFQRYEDHQLSLQQGLRPAPLAPLARIADGFVKVVVIAPLLQLAQGVLAPDAALGLINSARAIVAALVWLVFMFFNFSGYMDIVIGWARLCRFDLPENFNRPLLADSFLEFWGRWHMTMTQWFKTYVFSPLMMALGRRLQTTRQATLLASAIAFFLTFLLVGAWHGPTPAFLVCGVLLGLGAMVNQSARELLRQRQTRRRTSTAPAGMGSKASGTVLRLLGASFNFTYIALAVSPFWLTPSQFRELLTGLLGSASGSLAWLVICMALACALPALRAVMNAWACLSERWASRLQAPLMIALRVVLVVLALISAGTAAPDFVYKGL